MHSIYGDTCSKKYWQNICAKEKWMDYDTSSVRRDSPLRMPLKVVSRVVFLAQKSQFLFFLRRVRFCSTCHKYTMPPPERLCHVPIQPLSHANRGFPVCRKRLFWHEWTRFYRYRTNKILIYNALHILANKWDKIDRRLYVCFWTILSDLSLYVFSIYFYYTAI